MLTAEAQNQSKRGEEGTVDRSAINGTAIEAPPRSREHCRGQGGKDVSQKRRGNPVFRTWHRYFTLDITAAVITSARPVQIGPVSLLPRGRQALAASLELSQIVVASVQGSPGSVSSSWSLGKERHFLRWGSHQWEPRAPVNSPKEPHWDIK